MTQKPEPAAHGVFTYSLKTNTGMTASGRVDHMTPEQYAAVVAAIEGRPATAEPVAISFTHDRLMLQIGGGSWTEYREPVMLDIVGRKISAQDAARLTPTAGEAALRAAAERLLAASNNWDFTEGAGRMTTDACVELMAAMNAMRVALAAPTRKDA